MHAVKLLLEPSRSGAAMSWRWSAFSRKRPLSKRTARRVLVSSGTPREAGFSTNL